MCIAALDSLYWVAGRQFTKTQQESRVAGNFPFSFEDCQKLLARFIFKYKHAPILCTFRLRARAQTLGYGIANDADDNDNDDDLCTALRGTLFKWL